MRVRGIGDAIKQIIALDLLLTKSTKIGKKASRVIGQQQHSGGGIHAKLDICHNLSQTHCIC